MYLLILTWSSNYKGSQRSCPGAISPRLNPVNSPRFYKLVKYVNYVSVYIHYLFLYAYFIFTGAEMWTTKRENCVLQFTLRFSLDISKLLKIFLFWLLIYLFFSYQCLIKEVFENTYVLAHLMLARESKIIQFNLADNFMFIGFQSSAILATKTDIFLSVV